MVSMEMNQKAGMGADSKSREGTKVEKERQVYTKIRQGGDERWQVHLEEWGE